MNSPKYSGRGNSRIRVFLTVYTTLQAFALILVFGIGPHLSSGPMTRMDPEKGRGIVELVLPVFSGYVGLIVGFYFGTKDTNH